LILNNMIFGSRGLVQRKTEKGQNFFARLTEQRGQEGKGAGPIPSGNVSGTG